MRKIVVINITGGPVVDGDDLAFTEGGLVHALFAFAGLASEFDITILCPNLPGNHERRGVDYRGVRIECLGSSRWMRWIRVGGLSFIREALRYVKRERPDIVVGNVVLSSFLLRFVRHRTLKVGIIHHLYHAWEVDGDSRHAFRGLRVLERMALRLTSLDKVAVVNPLVRETLGKEGFCIDDIAVVGNGVDVDSYGFSERKVPNRLIYVGRLAELKNVDSLIKMVPMLTSAIPDVKLHIVGDGPQRAQLDNLVKDLGLSGSVTLHGYLPEKAKIELLKSSAVYLSLSVFEGFGIPVVEAMATGAVPVVTDIGAHRFIFQGEDVGCLVKDQTEMAATVLALLRDDAGRLDRAHRGRGLVERRWTWRRVSEQYRELLAT